MSFKTALPLLFVSIAIASASADVTVANPTNGAQVTSPVTFKGSSTAKNCSKGVASMGVYVDNVLKYVVKGNTLNTNLSVSTGSHDTTIQEWDYCGGSSYKKIPITVVEGGGVTVTAPKNNGTSGSPVNYVASATANGCSKGVASMGVYVENKLTYVSNGNKLNANIDLSPGTYDTVVQEWDYCGGSSFTPIKVTVSKSSGVTVVSPTQNGKVGSPVNYVASASTNNCSKGIASMGVWVDNDLKFVQDGDGINTNLSISSGTHNTVVQAWDKCGGASNAAVTITVDGDGGGSGTTMSNLQTWSGWNSWGELPPLYHICDPCSGVTWSMTKGIKDPSKSGNATKYTIGGKTGYSDALFSLPLIGDKTTQGVKDKDHSLIPTLHNFTYEVYFYGTNLALSQVLEFDINVYFQNMGFIFGQQCRIAGGHEWDIWDNVGHKWVSTGIACNPDSNSWNHLTITAERTSDNRLHYQTITLNGTTHTVDKYYDHYKQPDWYGVGVNFQLDGNKSQDDYSVYLDQFGFTYY